ncbi:hypothetical protein P746_00668 [Enterococcus faecalis CBRD01]|uniref:Uncharacterized protein n=3 Tax=Enterococcus faecalis TaxID=1351 RepID=A0A125W2F9_ENTFL|nr:hypothetical protein HMPREF9509_00823 [Enterococcus faecalis TX0411]EFM70736.1 hypothetical protein HMPREF9505_01144 [Enterococcus faecalis TX0109]EFM80802.1 hypothetical protein HMPREF9514_00283 [Enterococcus faecalis TX0855]EFM81491.1 hypothetical protein HMPREF9498_02908 [Enterococcus faecalis TX4248]EFQ11850.1 hypothetical protein HMPREF9504_02604 [Enterococcus faecalis TX0102]EFQ14821.1 hypothetical protein HMPREF9512_02894 [Enterococcus faecalis EnGen0311]EFT37319.1 hypothetical prot
MDELKVIQFNAFVNQKYKKSGTAVLTNVPLFCFTINRFVSMFV